MEYKTLDLRGIVNKQILVFINDDRFRKVRREVNFGVWTPVFNRIGVLQNIRYSCLGYYNRWWVDRVDTEGILGYCVVNSVYKRFSGKQSIQKLEYKACRYKVIMSMYRSEIIRDYVWEDLLKRYGSAGVDFGVFSFILKTEVNKESVIRSLGG